MRNFVVILLTCLCCVTVAQAQTYTDHLKKTNTAKASVTVNQSKQIDSLVNGNGQPAKTEKKIGNAVSQQKPVTNDKTATQHNEKTVAEQQRLQRERRAAENERRAEAERRRQAERREAANRNDSDSTHRQIPEKNENEHKRTIPTPPRQEEHEEEEEHPAVDMRKKVMRGSRKVNGYRIQVFSGGNSRADKQRAQQIGVAIKQKFPDQPVYVHFYSPSWKCRVGNYRSYSEARAMLSKIKAMGYRSATILQGKITVQD